MAMRDETSVGRSALVPPSRGLLALFAGYLHWYIGRHFHAMRVANVDRFPSATGPLIVYANHASWWDPLSLILLSRHFLPGASPLRAHGRRSVEALRNVPQARHVSH